MLGPTSPDFWRPLSRKGDLEIEEVLLGAFRALGLALWDPGVTNELSNSWYGTV